MKDIKLEAFLNRPADPSSTWGDKLRGVMATATLPPGMEDALQAHGVTYEQVLNHIFGGWKELL